MRDRQWTEYWASSLGSAFIVAQFVLWIIRGSGDLRWLVYVGIALWCVGVVFAWVPIFQLKRRGGVARGESYVKTTVLVDTGIYGIVRHPQFLSWPMFSVALMLMAQQWIVVVLGAASLGLCWLDFRKVDSIDVEKFGDAYRDYMQRVPGWNPVAGLWRWVRRRRARR